MEEAKVRGVLKALTIKVGGGVFAWGVLRVVSSV